MFCDGATEDLSQLFFLCPFSSLGDLLRRCGLSRGSVSLNQELIWASMGMASAYFV